VDFPETRTCCGQPAFNSGYRAEARTVARHFLDTFETSEAIAPAPCGRRSSG
jgi:L-lactate dehydrogenase complex protein LldE